MSKNTRNIVIGVLVAFLVSAGMAFLMVAAGKPVGELAFATGAFAGGFTFYILWNISGNRQVVAASDSERQLALSFTPPSGQALLYVVRRGFVAKAAGMDIMVDDVLRAHLKAPRFTCLVVAPGMHNVSAALGGGAGAQSRPQSHRLVLQPNQALGVQISVKMGAVQGSLAFDMLDDAALRQAIGNIKMVAPIAG